MGGYGSGRTPQHYTVEQAERLALADVLADVGQSRAELLAAIHQGRPAAGLLDLDATAMPGGGWRLWLCCPAAGCGRRCTALYRPPGAARWACRRCWRLTYTSSLDSDKRLAGLSVADASRQFINRPAGSLLLIKRLFPADYRRGLDYYRRVQKIGAPR